MIKIGQSVFLKSLLTNFMVVLIISVMLIPMNYQIIKIIKQQETKNQYTMLETGLNMVSNQLESLRNTLMTSTATQEIFTRLGAIDGYPGASDVNVINKAMEQISAITSSNTIIADIVLIFNRSGLVITSRQSFMTIEKFLRFYEITGMDLEIFGQYYQSALFGGGIRFYPCDRISSTLIKEIDTAFCYAVPLSVISGQEPKAVAYVFVRKEPVLESMLSASAREYGALSLCDQQGNVLLSYTVEFSREIQLRDTYFTLSNSSKTLQCVVRLPKQYFDGVMRHIRIIINLFIIAATAVGIIASIWATSRHTRPINRLMQHLASQGFVKDKNSDEYNAIVSTLETLRSENNAISRELTFYYETYRRNLIDRLLHSRVFTEEQLHQLNKQFPNFPKRFLVCYGLTGHNEIHVDSDTAVMRMLTTDFFRQKLPQSAIFHAIDTESFALIYPCFGTQTEAEREISDILQNANTSVSTKLVLASSRIYQRPQQVSVAFEEARMTYLRGYSGKADGGLLCSSKAWGDDLSQIQIRDLQELYRFMVAGDLANARRIIELFFYDTSPMSLDVEQRYYAIQMAIMMAWRDMFPGETHANLPKYRVQMNPIEILQLILSECEKFCSRVTEKRQNQRNDQKEQLITYLEEHYSDPELCGAVMADAFGISEKYLYSLFKNRTGYSPASYLQRLRMVQAAKLLSKTRMTVHEISQQVGFSNFSTFHKAFKREYGMPPGQYRLRKKGEIF